MSVTVKALFKGVHMSLILRGRPYPCQYLTHLCVIVAISTCRMPLFQGHIACHNFTLTLGLT